MNHALEPNFGAVSELIVLILLKTTYIDRFINPTHLAKIYRALPLAAGSHLDGIQGTG